MCAHIFVPILVRDARLPVDPPCTTVMSHSDSLLMSLPQPCGCSKFQMHQAWRNRRPEREQGERFAVDAVSGDGHLELWGGYC
jgi:hypothetical protein